MSFRIEEKLYIHSNHIINFKEFLIKHLAKKLFHSRIIKSLYFDNLNSEMYNDSIESLVPRKKIRIRIISFVKSYTALEFSDFAN